MSFNDITDRSNPGGGALVPPEASMQIFKQATQMSAALSLFRRVPILTNRSSFPVLSSQPKAYWLAGSTPVERDIAFIQTTEMAWKNVEMNVAEIAVIAPVPRRLVNDIASGGINLTEEMRPYLAQAIAQAVDQAIFFGINKPTAWAGTKSVYQGAVDAGNIQMLETAIDNGGLHTDLLNGMKMMASDGFMPDSIIGRNTFQFDLMNARDTTGQPLYIPEQLGGATDLPGRLIGRPVIYGTDGVFPDASVNDYDIERTQLIAFDSSKHLIGVREDIFMTVHRDGVIQDGNGNIVFNLMQQDVIALRAIARFGYAVANPATLAQPTEADRYPGVVYVAPSMTP